MQLKICDSHLTCKAANKCLNVRQRVEVVEWKKKMVPSLHLLSCELPVSVKENPDRKIKPCNICHTQNIKSTEIFIMPSYKPICLVMLLFRKKLIPNQHVLVLPLDQKVVYILESRGLLFWYNHIVPNTRWIGNSVFLSMSFVILFVNTDGFSYNSAYYWFELETFTYIFDFEFKHIDLSNYWVHHHFSSFGFFLVFPEVLRMHRNLQRQYLVMLIKQYCLL